MIIRKYKESDQEILKEITVICFDGVSIDQNIEKLYGPIAGKDWQWRKKRHIDNDVKANAEGIFVAEVDGKVVGYITTKVDHELKIGRISHLAVVPVDQKKGIGKKLINAAIEYLRNKDMKYVRIEALDQNDICMHFYTKYGFEEIGRQVNFIMELDRVTDHGFN